MNRNRLLQGLGGAALLVLAAWLGVDLTQNNDTATTSTSAEHPTSASKAAPQQAQRTGQQSNLPECPTNSLPDQANDVIDDILSGGPFEHPGIDGKHFGNYERILPKEKSSFYREYTVDTPGVNHRGERRIVVGGGTKQDPDTWYYTEDHYESFCIIPDAEK